MLHLLGAQIGWAQPAQSVRNMNEPRFNAHSKQYFTLPVMRSADRYQNVRYDLFLPLTNLFGSNSTRFIYFQFFLFYQIRRSLNTVRSESVKFLFCQLNNDYLVSLSGMKISCGQRITCNIRFTFKKNHKWNSKR